METVCPAAASCYDARVGHSLSVANPSRTASQEGGRARTSGVGGMSGRESENQGLPRAQG